MRMVKLLIGIAALTQLIQSSPAQSWITNGLVAYYPFNGNANDTSGYGNNGIATNVLAAIDRLVIQKVAMHLTVMLMYGSGRTLGLQSYR